MVPFASAAAAAPAAPFNECVPVGDDTSCGDLVDVTDQGTAIYADPSQGPYDGDDDTLVGVVNDSSEPVDAVVLSSDTDIFGFDGDGICGGFTPEPPACPYGDTGYEGPDTSFASINADATAGVVLFPTPLAPGASTYFGLEEALSATDVTGGGPSAGEQGGACNAAEHSVTQSCVAPVNIATGEFWHTFTDFSVGGRGVPLNLARTYTSANAATDGPFGFGWTDSYSMSLAIDASGVTVNQEDGSTVAFTPNGLGGYAAPPRVLASLVPNGDGTFTFTRDSDHVAFGFSAAGQLVSETDLNGVKTALAYDGSGQLATATDPAGRALTFTYSGSHVASVTDPMGRTEKYGYDAAGDLVSATDALSRTWTFAYDANHLLTSMTDPRGGVTANTYDSSARVVAQKDPQGGVTTLSYSGAAASPGGGSTTVTDPDGNATVENYANLELGSVVRGSGTSSQAVTTYTYDPGTLGVASSTDADGNATQYTYDADGNRLTSTDPLGRTTTYAYNGLDELTSVRSPLGETGTATYDSAGNLTATSDALGASTTYTHADAAHPGDVTSVTDPLGRTASFTYDANGDVASTTTTPSSGVTDTTTAVYDADGKQVCATSGTATAAHVSCPAAGGARVAGTKTTVYDAVGEVTSVTDPNGHTSTATYDADGNVENATDAVGNATAYTYDADNLVTATTRADGSALKATYDANGNVLTQVDGGGDTSAYVYDPLGRAISVTDALKRATSYTYDAAGNVITRTNPSGQVTTSMYDTANELTGIGYSDGTTPNVAYAYNADGHRTSMQDGTGLTTYSYDADQRLTGTNNGSGASVAYAYDAAGDLTKLTYPNGQTVTRGYDGAGQLVSVKDWLGNTTTFGYDANGSVTGESYPNGVQASYTYNAGGDLTGILDTHNAAALASYAYRYNANDLLTSDTETGTAGSTGTPITYSYTALNQLAAANGGSYGYDKAGNPVGQPGGVTQTFDAAGELTSTMTAGGTPSPSASPSISSSPTPSLSASASASPSPSPSTSPSPSNSPSPSTSPSASLSASASPSASPTPTGTPTGPPPGLAPTLDRIVNTVEKKAASPITAPALTTSGGGELIVAFVSADGPQKQRQQVTKVTGGQLKWSLAARADQTPGAGTAEVWTAYSAAPLSGVKVSASLKYTNYDGAITVAAYQNASPVVGATSTASATKGRPSTALTTSAAGSVVVAAGHNWSYATTETPVTGQKILTENLDTRVNDTYWSQTTGTIAAPGKVTIGDTASLAGLWDLAAVEIEPAAANSSHLAPNISPRVLGNDSSSPDASYGYDKQGNRTSVTPATGPATALTYNQANMLTSYAQASTTATYAYNGDGLRAAKKVNGTTTAFTWDMSSSDPLLLADGTTYFVYGPSEQPIEQITGSTPTYLLDDRQGSTRLLTDATGTVTGSYSYSPYGTTTTHTGTATTTLGYDGQYTDAESGYLYLRARYYDPGTAQFLSADPLASASGSAYGYVGGNPLGGSDPSGLMCGLYSAPCTPLESLGQWGQNSLDYLVLNANNASTLLGTGALATAPIPFVSIPLAMASAFLGGIGGADDYAKRDYVGMALDLANYVLSVTSAGYGAAAIVTKGAYTASKATLESLLISANDAGFMQIIRAGGNSSGLSALLDSLNASSLRTGISATAFGVISGIRSWLGNSSSPGAPGSASCGTDSTGTNDANGGPLV